MIYLKTNGLRLGDGSKNNLPEEYVYAAEPLQQGPRSSTSGAIGRGSIAVGVSEVLGSFNVPNPVDFFKGIWGSFTDNSELVTKFDSEFRTLGNGKFDINDVLAFPVNWGIRLTDNVFNKVKVTDDKGNVTKVKRPGYGSKEYFDYMKAKFPDYKPQGNKDKDIKKYGEVVNEIINEIKKVAGYGEAR